MSTPVVRPGHHRRRGLVGAVLIGLALAVVALAVPVIDATAGHLLADHLRLGYPQYTEADIAAAVTVSAVALSTVAGLAVICWLVTLVATVTRRRWSWVFALAVLIVGGLVVLTTMMVPDTSGRLGFPLSISATLMLPTVAGAVIVVLRRDRAGVSRAGAVAASH